MKRQNKLPFFLLITLCLIALFGRLGSTPLGHEEPRRAVIALELLYGDNFLQPTLHGENYYRKPPLYNWVLASFYKITGQTNEFVSRLPSVFSFIILVFFVYFFTKKYFDKEIAILVSIIFFASEDLLLYYSRMAEMDLFYSLLTLPVIVLPWAFLNEQKKWQFYIIPPFLAALGFISKGLPSLVYLGISMVCAILLHKKYRLFISPWVIVSMLVFLLPLSIYFLPQYFDGNLEESLKILFAESLNRTTATSKDFYARIAHFFIFPLDILKGLLPFSLLIFFVKKDHFQNKYIQAIGVLFLANMAIYMFSPGAKLRYVYMLFPLLSIVFAYSAKFIKGEIIYQLNSLVKWLLLIMVLLGFSLLIYFKSIDYIVILAMIILVFYFILHKNYVLPYYSNILVSMLFLRICIDFIAIQPEIIGKDHAYLEKNDAIALYEKYNDRNVYINTKSERYYTFTFNLSALKKQALNFGFEYNDKNGVYIIRPENKPENMVKICDFKIGNDSNFILVEWP